MTTEEWERVYGPLGRVEFVQQLPCIASHETRCPGPSQNHHTKNGGTSRKGDCETVVPLCFDHHIEVHSVGAKTFSVRHLIDWQESAALTEYQWQNHLQREL